NGDSNGGPLTGGSSGGLNDITALRKKLFAAGFTPLPANAKAVFLNGWRTVPVDEISIGDWQQRCNDTNTSIRTTTTPVFDCDIYDTTVADEIELAAMEIVGYDNGKWLRRFGQEPKRAIPFRTDEPFEKMVTRFFESPDGRRHRVEILGNGQQLVA